jgi:hypothetical protein
MNGLQKLAQQACQSNAPPLADASDPYYKIVTYIEAGQNNPVPPVAFLPVLYHRLDGPDISPTGGGRSIPLS